MTDTTNILHNVMCVSDLKSGVTHWITIEDVQGDIVEMLGKRKADILTLHARLDFEMGLDEDLGFKLESFQWSIDMARQEPTRFTATFFRNKAAMERFKASRPAMAGRA